MKVLEIVCLENGDVVLVEAPDTEAADNAVVEDKRRRQDVEQVQPLVSIRFSTEVREMLGDDAIEVAEAMIEAATAYISDSAGSSSGDFGLEQGLELGADRIESDLEDFEDHVSTAPVILH